MVTFSASQLNRRCMPRTAPLVGYGITLLGVGGYGLAVRTRRPQPRLRWRGVKEHESGVSKFRIARLRGGTDVPSFELDPVKKAYTTQPTV